MQGTRRIGLLGLALAALLACTVEALEAVPAYPGASLGPGSRQELGDQLLLKQTYRTPDSYLDVVEYYEGYIAKQRGWEGRANGDGFALFRKNLQLDGMLATAKPVDPGEPGAAILITITPDSTQIQTFNSFPGQDG
jgi:hypothetical protein